MQIQSQVILKLKALKRHIWTYFNLSNVALTCSLSDRELSQSSLVLFSTPLILHWWMYSEKTFEHRKRASPPVTWLPERVVTCYRLLARLAVLFWDTTGCFTSPKTVILKLNSRTKRNKRRHPCIFVSTPKQMTYCCVKQTKRCVILHAFVVKGIKKSFKMAFNKLVN